MQYSGGKNLSFKPFKLFYSSYVFNRGGGGGGSPDPPPGSATDPGKEFNKIKSTVDHRLFKACLRDAIRPMPDGVELMG